MQITIYGIPNCDTIKKTINWFKINKVSYQLHDYKIQGIAATKLTSWIEQVGLGMMVNKKSTTFKLLTAAQQAEIAQAASAIYLLQKYFTVLKRPIVELNHKVMMIGFDEQILVSKIRMPASK